MYVLKIVNVIKTDSISLNFQFKRKEVDILREMVTSINM